MLPEEMGSVLISKHLQEQQEIAQQGEGKEAAGAAGGGGVLAEAASSAAAATGLPTEKTRSQALWDHMRRHVLDKDHDCKGTSVYSQEMLY